MDMWNQKAANPNIPPEVISIEKVREYGEIIDGCKDSGSLCIIAKALWRLLDDIDTASDMFKPTDLDGYKAFYKYSMRKANKRFGLLESDGYNLYLPKK